MADAPVARKRSKAPDHRPARIRYWLGKHLEKNKVRHLMRWGMSLFDATEYWKTHRVGRIKAAK